LRSQLIDNRSGFQYQPSTYADTKIYRRRRQEEKSRAYLHGRREKAWNDNTNVNYSYSSRRRGEISNYVIDSPYDANLADGGSSLPRPTSAPYLRTRPKSARKVEQPKGMELRVVIFDVEGDAPLTGDHMVGAVNITVEELYQNPGGVTRDFKKGGSITLKSSWSSRNEGDLYISCQGLNPAEGQDSVDPIVGVYGKRQDSNEFNLPLGQTEHLEYESDPVFETAIHVTA